MHVSVHAQVCAGVMCVKGAVCGLQPTGAWHPSSAQRWVSSSQRGDLKSGPGSGLGGAGVGPQLWGEGLSGPGVRRGRTSWTSPLLSGRGEGVREGSPKPGSELRNQTSQRLEHPSEDPLNPEVPTCVGPAGAETQH